MAENRVPTLLVGLGGIGSSIVDITAKALPKELKPYVGAVGIDTNIEDLKKLENIKTIWIGQDGLVKNLLDRYPEYMKWFPSNRFVNNREIKDGAGQVRAISRLAVATSVRGDRNVFLTLDQEIDRVLAHNGEVNVSKFNVFIAGSITGGTGAGCFLQIPFYIREYVKKKMANTSISIRGMFVSADITAAVNPSIINRNAVKVNAYACMKELNAFYLTQIMEDEDIHLSLEFYDMKERDAAFARGAEKLRAQGFLPGDNITEEEFRARVMEMVGEGANVPYDAFYLVEGTDNAGTIGNASLDTVKQQLAKTIFVILFTPVRPIAAGINDNGVLLDMECSGMNRYSSAGLTTLRYPYEQMMEYVTLQYCKKLISEEWLILDREFEQEKKDSMDRQRSDPNVAIPKLPEVYTRLFEKESGGGEGTRLGKLRGEAYIINENSTAAPKSRLTGYLNAIDDKIGSLTKEDGALKAAMEACSPNLDEFKEYDSAKTEVQNMLAAIQQFTLQMKNVVKKRQYEVANEVFPESYDSMVMHQKSPLSIYSFLGHTHPVAARYLCYKMILELDQRVKDLGGKSVQAADLNNFYDKDYDDSKEGVQSAEQVINSAENARLLFVIPKGKGILRSVTEDFTDAVAAQVRLIRKFGDEQIKLTTYRTLLRRFRQLAEHYETFFANMGSRIEANDTRIMNLEKAYEKNPYGERIIYGSEDAFKKTFEDYCKNAEFELPEAAKEAVFTGLYRQACVSFDSTESTAISQETQKIMKRQIEESIAGLFDSAIMKKMGEYAAEKGGRLIDISIKEAMERELILKGVAPSSEDYNERRIAYEREQIQLAMVEAAPMLAVSGAENISENVYLAMHPDSAELEAGSPSKTATENNLVPEATEATDMRKPYVLIDRGFSRHEMICLKARHKYMVEHLVKYGPDSEFADLYRKRIQNLDQEPTEIGVDAFKTVVTPHLNRYWHEEGFIPALTADERRTTSENMLKAFIYAMGMDVFVQEEEAGLRNAMKWKYVGRNRNRSLVKDQGMAIGNGYADLYYALKNNKFLVKNILDRAAQDRRETSKTLNILMEEDMVNALPLLRDLIQEVKEEDDANILDILDSMLRREYMEESAWNKLFKGLELTLTEYLSSLFEKNPKRSNAIYAEAIERLYASSACGRKEAEAQEQGILPDNYLDPVERKIRSHINILRQVRIY